MSSSPDLTPRLFEATHSLLQPLPSAIIVLHDSIAGELTFTDDGDSWRCCEVESLELELQIESHPETTVLRPRLINHGTTRLLQMVKYRLEFAASDAIWRVLTGGPGGHEGSYPPPSYEIRDRAFLDTARLAIGSPPGGRSSDANLPMLICSRADAGLWLALEWSAEWYMRAGLDEQTGHRRFSVEAGVWVDKVALHLDDSLLLPALHLGTFRGDLAAGSNSLRRYIYDTLAPEYDGERPYPRVSYDHWFGIWNGFDAALLMRQMDRAAELGVEKWCLDAGWFGDFPQAVGDWDQPLASRLPDGLEPLADYCRSKGMDFGLWFDIERAHVHTWAVREHPQHFLEIPGSEWYHLNLAKPAAREWALEIISGYAKRLDLGWMRFDYNINPAPYWQLADPTNRIQFDYCEGLYYLLDELRRRHPRLMIENCASGGRRIDFGTLARTHTNWFSDFTDGPHPCRWMQLRSARFLPGHVPNSSVAIRREVGIPEAMIDCAVLSRANGKLAFDGDISSLNPAATERARFWVDTYKAHRHLFVQAFHQLSPIPCSLEEWDIVQWSSWDNEERLIAAFRVQGDPTCTVSLPGIDADQEWTLLTLATGETHPQRGPELTLHLPPNAAAWYRVQV